MARVDPASPCRLRRPEGATLRSALVVARESGRYSRRDAIFGAPAIGMLSRSAASGFVLCSVPSVFFAVPKNYVFCD
jgi:hypothetical protein